MVRLWPFVHRAHQFGADGTGHGTRTRGYPLAGEVELLLYPNPTDGEQVRLIFGSGDPMAERISVDMYDPSGRVVLTRTLPATDGFVDQMLDLGMVITSGLYTVRVTAGESVTTQRLVVVR